MPPSKKEKRKMAKANRRAKGESQVLSRCSSLPLAQDIVDDSLISLSASAERDGRQLGGYGAGGGKPCTARSLNDIFANLAAHQLPATRKEKVHASIHSATFPRTASLPLFLSDRDSDPFTDSDLHRALERVGAISKIHEIREDSSATTIHEKRTKASTDPTPRSIASLKEITRQIHLQTPRRDCPEPEESLDGSASVSHPRVESNEEFPPFFKSKINTPQTKLQPTPNRLSGSDDSDQQGVPCRETSDFTPSRPIEPHNMQSSNDFFESFDGCRDPQSHSSPQSSRLSDIDTGSRREHLSNGKPHPQAMDLSSFASFKAAAIPVRKIPGVPAPKTPPPIVTRVPEAAFKFDARPVTSNPHPRPLQTLFPDAVPVPGAGINVDVESVSESPDSPPLPLGTTSVTMRVQEVAIDTDARPVTKGPDTPLLKASSIGHSPASVTPSQATTLVESPRMNDVPSVSTGTLMAKAFAARVWNRSRLVHAPGRPHSFGPTSTDRYQQDLYELQLKHFRRRQHPDWTQDARGRVITPLQAHPRPIEARHEIQEQGKHAHHISLMSEEHTKLMSQYTQCFYGSDLDGARKLPRTMLQSSQRGTSDCSLRPLG
ncbi:MAG: hypothetical protein Q9184_001002 [Pyrenodesmia sp. 2 TL-2023]